MLGDMGAGYGSVMIKIRTRVSTISDASIKCYAHVVHHIKACGITVTLPKSNVNAARKLQKIEDVLRRLRQCDISGFRFEGVFHGEMTLHNCFRSMQQHEVIECVPGGIDVVCTEQYIQNVWNTIEENRSVICHGKSTGEPSPSQVLALIKVLNTLGLYSEKWARLLTSSNPLIREGIKLANKPGVERDIRSIIKNV